MNQEPENYILVKNQIYYTLRFYFPHLSLLAQPVNILYLLTGYEGNSKIIDPAIPTNARGEDEFNSWYRGINTLTIPRIFSY